jgi:hypothetical protein
MVCVTSALRGDVVVSTAAGSSVPAPFDKDALALLPKIAHVEPLVWSTEVPTTLNITGERSVRVQHAHSRAVVVMALCTFIRPSFLHIDKLLQLSYVDLFNHARSCAWFVA